jgi:hypothetical protein
MSAARIEIGSETPAYPNLIPAMARLMQANYRLGVTEATEPSEADLVWVLVTGEASPSEEQRKQILAAITSGKTIFADVVSGNRDWDENFRALLPGLSRGITVERLNRNDPVFTGEIAGTQGFDRAEVELRKPLHTRFSTRGRCDLYRISFNGKPVGVYSAHDVSSGIGYQYFPQCRGVIPEHARQIAMNVFLTGYGRAALGRSQEQAKAAGGSS